jgi:hypothetical protein
MFICSALYMTLGPTVSPVEPTDLLQTSAVSIANWFGRDATKKDFKILRYPRDTNYFVIGSGLTINLKPDGTLRWANDDQRQEIRTKSANRGRVRLSEATIKNVALRLAKQAYPKSTFSVIDFQVVEDDYRSELQQRSWDSGCARVRLLMDEHRGQAYRVTIKFEMDTRELTGISRGGPFAADRWRPKGTDGKGGG